MDKSVTTPTPSPDDVFRLVDDIVQFLKKREQELDGLKAGLDMRQGRVKKAEKVVDERHKQLAEWEKALNVRYEDVSRKENALKLEAEREKMHIQTEKRLTDIVHENKKNVDLLAEIKQREKEVLDRELAVTQREKDYRKKIEAEIGEKMFHNYTSK